MIKVPNEIFQWLADPSFPEYEEVLESSLHKGQHYALFSVGSLLNGSLLLCLTNKVCAVKNLPYLAITISKNHFNNSMSSRLINWQLIQKQLKGLGVIVDNDTKSLIAHGDYALAFDTLSTCFKKLVNPEFQLLSVNDIYIPKEAPSPNKSVLQLSNFAKLHKQSSANVMHNNTESEVFSDNKGSGFGPKLIETPYKQRDSRGNQENQNALTSHKKFNNGLGTKLDHKSRSVLKQSRTEEYIGDKMFGIYKKALFKVSHKDKQQKKTQDNVSVMKQTLDMEPAESVLALFKSNDSQYHLYTKKKQNLISAARDKKTIGKQNSQGKSSSYSFQHNYKRLLPNTDFEKCENLLELLILAISKSFHLDPKDCLKFFFNRCAYLNELWRLGEGDHGFCRLAELLKTLDGHHEQIVLFVCNQNSDTFFLFMSLYKSIWSTASVEIARLYVQFLLNLLRGFKACNKKITLAQADDELRPSLPTRESAQAETKSINNSQHKLGSQRQLIKKAISHDNFGNSVFAVHAKKAESIPVEDLFKYWLQRNGWFVEGLFAAAENFPDLCAQIFDFLKALQTAHTSLPDVLQDIRSLVNNKGQYFKFLDTMLEVNGSKMFLEVRSSDFCKNLVAELEGIFLKIGFRSRELNPPPSTAASKFANKPQNPAADKNSYSGLAVSLPRRKSSVTGKSVSVANQKALYPAFFNIMKILIRLIVREDFLSAPFVKGLILKLGKLLLSTPHVRDTISTKGRPSAVLAKEASVDSKIDVCQTSARTTQQPAQQSALKIKSSKIPDIVSQCGGPMPTSKLKLSDVKESTLPNNSNNSSFIIDSKAYNQFSLTPLQKMEVLSHLLRLYFCGSKSIADIRAALETLIVQIITAADSGSDDIKDFIVSWLLSHKASKSIDDFLTSELLGPVNDYFTKTSSKRALLALWEVKLVQHYLKASGLRMPDKALFVKNVFKIFIEVFEVSGSLLPDLTAALANNQQAEQFLPLLLHIVKECLSRILDAEHKTQAASDGHFSLKAHDLSDHHQFNRKTLSIYKDLQRQALLTSLIKEVIRFQIQKVNDYAKLLLVFFNKQYKNLTTENDNRRKNVPNSKTFEALYSLVKEDDNDILAKYETAVEVAIKHKGLLQDECIQEIANGNLMLGLNDIKGSMLLKDGQQLSGRKGFHKHIKDGSEVDERVKRSLLNAQKNYQEKIEREAKQLTMQLEKNKIAFGVASAQVAKLFKQLEVTKKSSYASADTIHFIEKTVVVNFMKEYRRFFKAIFKYYSSQGHGTYALSLATSHVSDSPEQHSNPANDTFARKLMYPSQFWKMMTHLGLSKLMNFETFNNEIIKGCVQHQSLAKPRPEGAFHYNAFKDEKLDFQTFQQFFLNLFCRCFLSPGKLINPADLHKMMSYIVDHCKDKHLKLDRLYNSPLVYKEELFNAADELRKALQENPSSELPSNFMVVKFTRFDDSCDFTASAVFCTDLLDDIINVNVLQGERLQRTEYPFIKAFSVHLPKEKSASSSNNGKHSEDFYNREELIDPSGTEMPSQSHGPRPKKKIVNKYMRTLEEKKIREAEEDNLRRKFWLHRDKYLKEKIKECQRNTKSSQSNANVPASNKKPFKLFDLKKYITRRLKSKSQHKGRMRGKPGLSTNQPLKNLLNKLTLHFSKILTTRKKMLDQARQFAEDLNAKAKKYQKASLDNCEKFKASPSSPFHELLKSIEEFKCCSIHNDLTSSMRPILRRIFESYATYYLKYDFFERDALRLNLKVLYIFLRQFGFVPNMFKVDELVQFLNNYMFQVHKDAANKSVAAKEFDFENFADLFYALLIYKRQAFASLYEAHKEAINESVGDRSPLGLAMGVEGLGDADAEFTASIVKSVLAFNHVNGCAPNTDFILTKIIK